MAGLLKEKISDSKTAEQKHSGQRTWSSRSLGSHWQHRFFYALLRLGGLKPARFCLFFVVLFFALHPGIARRAKPYLKHRFGKASFRHVFKLYWIFAQVLLERAASGVLGKNVINTKSDYQKILQNLLDEGKGLILLSAHVGAWQIALAGLRFGVKVNIVQPRGLGDVDRHFFEHKADNAPDVTEFSIIDSAGAFGGWLDMLAALRRGEIVCLMGDRLLEQEKLVLNLPFLGTPAAFPASSYVLASLSGAPLTVFFSKRIDKCLVECSCVAQFHIPPGLRRSEAALQPYAEKFMLALEKYVGENPYQFYNFYNLWA